MSGLIRGPGFVYLFASEAHGLKISNRKSAGFILCFRADSAPVWLWRMLVWDLERSAETLALASLRARPRHPPAGDAPGPVVHLNVRSGVAGGVRLSQQPAVSDSGVIARYLDGVWIYRPPVTGRTGIGFPLARAPMRRAEADGARRDPQYQALDGVLLDPRGRIER